MSVRVNLCCGDHILPGWLNCDPRHGLGPIRRWQWGEPVPCGDGRADIVLVAYGWMYAAKGQHPRLLLDIWRALVPGGRLVVKEDDDRIRVWRPIGTTHFTGRIASTSNEPEMTALMEAAGFLVSRGVPPDLFDELDTHRRARAASYVLTGTK